MVTYILALIKKQEAPQTQALQLEATVSFETVGGWDQEPERHVLRPTSCPHMFAYHPMAQNPRGTHPPVLGPFPSQSHCGSLLRGVTNCMNLAPV